jgi:beta-lactamase superfamily II metal-dependent hydrolase
MSDLILTMNPASEGDALMLTWGAAATPRRLLVDMGRGKDYKAAKSSLEEIGAFELFVITHIDADHIAGAVPLFKESALPFKAKHVWFNAHRQLDLANQRLPPASRVQLSAPQAEKVTAGIIKSEWPWNTHFASGIVSVDSPEAAEPILLDGDLSLTLLSPSDRKLAELIPVWNTELERAKLRGIDPDEVDEAIAAGRIRLGGLNVADLAKVKFQEDKTKPNGSSIAFIAEHDGKRVLLTGDAHPATIERSLRSRGFNEANRCRIDCLKVSHHGSKGNTSPELLKILDCTCFAISTDGTRHDHPDAEAIARILQADPGRPKTLIFNFRQHYSEQWDNEVLKAQWNYKCRFPHDGRAGVEFKVVKAQ